MADERRQEPSVPDARPARSVWLEALTSRAEVDDDFRRTFERTPGKALRLLGVPYNELAAVLHEWRESREFEGG